MPPTVPEGPENGNGSQREEYPHSGEFCTVKGYEDRFTCITCVAPSVCFGMHDKAIKADRFGKWQRSDGGKLSSRDGTAVTSSSTGSREMKYRLIDDKTIETSTPQGIVASHLIIESLTADELTLRIRETGSSDTFRRVK